MNHVREYYEDVKSILEASGFTVLTGESSSKESSSIGATVGVMPPTAEYSKEGTASWSQQLVYVVMMAQALPSKTVRVDLRECTDTERTRYFTHKLYISSIDYTGESDET